MGIELATLATYATIASAGVGIYTALEQGKSAAAYGDYVNEQAQADANAAKSQAQVEADRIRKAGDKQRSMARADLAGSGVTVGVGTAEQIDQEINRDVEIDSLMAIYNGDTYAQQIRAQGKNAKQQGKSAQTASYFTALQTGAQGAFAAAKGWKTTSTSSQGYTGGYSTVAQNNVWTS